MKAEQMTKATWTQWELAYVTNMLTLLRRGDYGRLREGVTATDLANGIASDANQMARRHETRATDATGVKAAVAELTRVEAVAPNSVAAANARNRLGWHKKQIRKATSESARYSRLAAKLRSQGLPPGVDVTPVRT